MGDAWIFLYRRVLYMLSIRQLCYNFSTATEHAIRWYTLSIRSNNVSFEASAGYMQMLRQSESAVYLQIAMSVRYLHSSALL